MVNQRSEHLDSVFHALAHPTRREMVRRLASEEHNVGELAEPFNTSLAAVSKHIKVLERAGLVRRTVQGRTHVCSLNPEPLSDAQEWLRYYERFWNERLDALERELNASDPTQRRGTDDG